MDITIRSTTTTTLRRQLRPDTVAIMVNVHTAGMTTRIVIILRIIPRIINPQTGTVATIKVLHRPLTRLEGLLRRIIILRGERVIIKALTHPLHLGRITHINNRIIPTEESFRIRLISQLALVAAFSIPEILIPVKLIPETTEIVKTPQSRCLSLI